MPSTLFKVDQELSYVLLSHLLPCRSFVSWRYSSSNARFPEANGCWYGELIRGLLGLSMRGRTIASLDAALR